MNNIELTPSPHNIDEFRRALRDAYVKRGGKLPLPEREPNIDEFDPEYFDRLKLTEPQKAMRIKDLTERGVYLPRPANTRDFEKVPQIQDKVK